MCHFFKYLVVLLEAAVEVLLVDEIDADCLIPVDSVDMFESLFDLLLSEGLLEVEDDAHTELGVAAADLLEGLVECHLIALLV